VFSEDFLGADVVFPALHGKYGEDGTVQGLCEVLNIPYVGCGVLSSAVCLDKPVSKRLAAGVRGLGQVEFLEIHSDELKRFDDFELRVSGGIGYPCFVKPVTTGSSCGISKVCNKDELFKALSYASEFEHRLMVEKAVSGRELEVGVIGNRKPIVSGVGEIVHKSGFYDYDTKYTEGAAEVIFSAKLDENKKDEIRRFALEVYRALGCEGMARVDFFMENGTNSIIFNEVNTVPGFTPTSMFHKLFAEDGIPLPKLLDKLVEFAIERVGKQ